MATAFAGKLNVVCRALYANGLRWRWLTALGLFVFISGLRIGVKTALFPWFWFLGRFRCALGLIIAAQWARDFQNI